MEKSLAGVRHLIGSELGLDLLQNALALDAGELAGGMQDVPVQLWKAQLAHASQRLMDLTALACPCCFGPSDSTASTLAVLQTRVQVTLVANKRGGY